MSFVTILSLDKWMFFTRNKMYNFVDTLKGNVLPVINAQLKIVLINFFLYIGLYFINCIF